MHRIALISEHASPLAVGGSTDSGGQNVYVAHVARQLAKSGWHVDVFTRRDDEAQEIIVDWLPRVRVINVPAGPAVSIAKEKLLPYMAEFAHFMQGFIRDASDPYDLLHANFFMSGWVGLQLKHIFGLPLVMTFHALGKVRHLHQGDSDLFPSERFDIEQQIVEEADRIIAECPQDRSDLIEHYNADPRRIEVVPCGFDTAEFEPIARADARSQLQWPEDEFCILQLGRMVPRKGVDDVIRALAALGGQSGIRAQLYIVGGNTDVPDANATPEIGRLAALAKSLGVCEQVRFTGRRGRKDLALYYSAADVFVTTPWYEPFGITPLEAMACAVPVVGAAVGGIQHSVVDGKTGYLVPAKNPAAIAERLAVLAGDPVRRATMGAAGWARVHRLFTWAKVSASLANIYGRTIDQTYASGIRRLHAMAAGVGLEMTDDFSKFVHDSTPTTALANTAI
ncbi:MAG: glycosyltransferase family 1 protein [Rhodocyclales bacterium]|nr:glycosyltransferase family 1 protein [Rhodocyclales bacterium]